MFKEYERLTKLSGLELNADKTEIMHLKKEKNGDPLALRIDYMNSIYNINVKTSVKINGIFFQQKFEDLIDQNVDAALVKINQIFRNWSVRNLSILGKILVTKSFAISQVVYLMQTLDLDDKHIKRINGTLYKFIWNRHYLAAKAPERVKRDIMTSKITQGGFGMLDISKLNNSLKLRGLGRIKITNHPFLKLIRDNLDMANYFFPTQRCNLDKFSAKGVQLISNYRYSLLTDSSKLNQTKVVQLIREIRIKNIVSERGKLSIAYNMIRNLGKHKLRELSEMELNSISYFIDKKIINQLKTARSLRIEPVRDNYAYAVEIKGAMAELSKLTSKEIREMITNHDPICTHKFGTILTPREALTWGNNLRRVTCVRNRSVMLRAAHGDIYTRVKLHRYGLIESPECPRCGQLEDLEHKFITCPYVERIWNIVLAVTRINDHQLIQNKIMAATRSSNPLKVAIHAEIMARILALKDDQPFVLRPVFFVKLALKKIKACELNEETKEKLDSLISSLR